MSYSSKKTTQKKNTKQNNKTKKWTTILCTFVYRLFIHRLRVNSNQNVNSKQTLSHLQIHFIVISILMSLFMS